MGRIKQSITFGPFCRGGLSGEQVIAEAARIGMQSVEMLPQNLWPVVKDHGMGIAIVSGHKSLKDGLNRPENHDRIEAELREKIDLAAENDIPSLICFSGNRYDGLTDDAGIDVCAAGLARVVEAAEAKGITLCMELLNSKVNHPDYQCDSTPWGVEVCRRVGSPRVKLLYDIYHMQIMEGDLIRTITENIEYIGHFHTAGNPGRNDMDDTQEIYYPAVMRAIAATGYDGYVGHEFLPKGDPLAAMRAAFETCDV